MEPIIPRRKKIQNVYKDIHNLIAEPLMQRKKRDQSTSPVKFNNEPDFKSKRKFKNIYKNKTTSENPKFDEISQKNETKTLNGKQNNFSDNNFDAWPVRLRKSKSAHNIGRSKGHTDKKNMANMPPAGCPTMNPYSEEYVLLGSKVPYRLKSSNFPMNNSAIQDLYRPVFANDSDYIVLKNSIPYHLKKHSRLISKNSETGDWWINNEFADNSSSKKLDNENPIVNSKETHNKVGNLQKYRRSQSQGDHNHRRRLYKDDHETNKDYISTTNNQTLLHTKNNSSQTINLNMLNENSHSSPIVNNMIKKSESPPKVNINAPIKSPEYKNIKLNNKSINDKNIMVTKSEVANFVAQKHEEKKKRIKNPEIQPTSIERNDNLSRIFNTNLNEEKNIPSKVNQLNYDNIKDLKKNNMNSKLIYNNVKPVKIGNYLTLKPNTSMNESNFKTGTSRFLGNQQRLSEYQRQFQWLSNFNVSPIIKAHNYHHTSQPNLSQLNKVDGKTRDQQLVNLSKSEDRKRQSQSVDPIHPYNSDRGYYSSSEYASNFNKPSQFNYNDNLRNKKLFMNSGIQGQEKQVVKNSNNSWYDQVIELRQRAEEYRSRGQGENFSRNHLGQLIAQNLQLWDAASKSTVYSYMPSTSTTHRSNNISTARTNSYITREPIDTPKVLESSRNNINSGQENSSNFISKNEIDHLTNSTQRTLKNSSALANDILLRAQTRSNNFWSGI